MEVSFRSQTAEIFVHGLLMQLRDVRFVDGCPSRMNARKMMRLRASALGGALLVVLNAVLPLSAVAQTPYSDTTAPSLATVWADLEQAVALVDRINTDSLHARDRPRALFAVGCALPRPEEGQARALEHEASFLQGNVGVSIEGRYGQETRQFTDDFGAGLSGTFVGLDWDLLSSGFLGNRRASKVRAIRARAARTRGALAHIQRTETCRARRVQTRFEGLVASALDAKIRLAAYQKYLVRRAYLEGETLLDDLLDVESELRSSRQRLRQIREERRTETDLPPFQSLPPLWDLDFADLERAPHGDSLRRVLGDVRRSEIALQEKTTWDTRLSVFGRYSTSPVSGNDDVEFGVRIRQPLFGSLFRDNEQATSARIEQQRRAEDLALYEQRENLRTVRRRFDEDQARAIRAHHRVLQRRERMRRHLGQRAVDNHERVIEALRHAQDLLDAVVEKTTAYGEVYEEVGRAFSAAREPFDAQYLSRHSLTGYRWRGRTGHRALYVWSDAFRTHSNAFLVELARARQLRRLIVSAGHNTPTDKLRALQEIARDQKLNVEFLLAANHWVQKGGVARARERLSTLELNGAALHLDVEPHALDAFDTQPKALLDRYLEVLRVARTAAEGRPLAVSLPLIWPDDVYREVASIVDRVYLMAYGDRSDRDRASEVLNVARLLPNVEVAVALRPEDFSSAWDLDQTISVLRTVVETDRFALHDLESFLQLVGDTP